MKEIDEILALESISDRIEKLKSGRIKPLPDIDAIKRQWDVYQHKTITDKIYLPDRMVDDGNGNERPQAVNRIALPLQKRIVNTAVSFAFGNPVELHADVKDKSDESIIYEAVKTLSHECKLKSVNRRMYRELLRSTEVAEYWHYVKDTAGKHNIYGFETDYKIRVTQFVPFDGDELYPYYDKTNDMIAFSRQFKRIDAGKTITYFETYTDKQYILWIQSGNEWTQEEPVSHTFGKIPIIYITQDAVEWVDVQICIERLEFMLSKFAETNDYHASPKIFVQGKIKSFVQKNDSGGIIEGETGSTAQYLSWANAPEAIRLEIETMIRFIYGQTQTPDISFDSVKGLHQISGEALKMLFMDAHLKVQEKREILDDFLQRRVNIQKRILGTIGNLKAASDKVKIEPEIIPYIVDDTTTLINNLMTASGGKPIVSQKTAIKMLGWVDDVEVEIQQIEEEEKQRSMADVFQPTI